MDVIVELLPASFTAKTEPAAKDSSRQQREEKKQHKVRCSTQNAQQASLKVTDKAIYDKERRTGEERRQQRMKRGRWLESRDRNDRRSTVLTVFVKV